MTALMSDRQRLVDLGACSEATRWLGDRTLDEGWAVCDKPDWMLWLINKLAWRNGDPFGTAEHRRLVGCLAAIVREVASPHWCGQDRSVLDECMKMTERYAAGEDVTMEQLRKSRKAAAYTAADAADAAAADAAAAAAAAAAAYAVDAAAYAADSAAAYAAYAADAAAAYAADAADAAAAAAYARKKAKQQEADIIRQHYPTPPTW